VIKVIEPLPCGEASYRRFRLVLKVVPLLCRKYMTKENTTTAIKTTMMAMVSNSMALT
jgi:hypothetical protein